MHVVAFLIHNKEENIFRKVFFLIISLKIILIAGIRKIVFINFIYLHILFITCISSILSNLKSI